MTLPDTATDLRVGGRLEAVAPRPVTDTGDRVRLLALVGVAVAVHAWVVAHTAVTARDSVGFARIALQFEDPAAAGLPVQAGGGPPTVVDVLKASQHPPGYPVAVLATSWVVRAVYPAALQDQMLLATQVASSVAGVLLVFPTYWLGRTLAGKFAGFAAALLFQVLPVPAHLTSDGLTEGLYTLGLGTALLFGTRAVRSPGVGGFLLCGLATGLTYLVRPEGLLAAGAVGAVAVGMAAARRWAAPAAAAWVAALAVGVALPAAPYMVLIEGVTNKPTGNGIFRHLRSVRELIAGGQAAGPARSPAVFAAWYDPQADGPLAGWVPAAIAKEGAKTFHYIPAGLAVLGLAAAGRRARREPHLWVPVAFGGLMLGAVGTLAYVGQTTNPADPGARQHYVSERHTLSLVYVGCLFAGAALAALPGLVRGVGRVPGADWAGTAALAAVAATCLPAAAKPLHENRRGHVEAGRWLAAHLTPADTLVDPFEWAQFYAGRTLRRIPPDPNQGAVYAVVERSKNDSPHSHLHRLQAAQNVAADGRAAVAFRWPEGGKQKGQSEVLVYKLDPTTQRN